MPPRKSRKGLNIETPTSSPAAESSNLSSQSKISRTALPEVDNPSKTFGKYVHALNSELQELLRNLEESRIRDGRSEQIVQKDLDSIVDGILAKLQVNDILQDVGKTTLEKALESTVINLPTLINGNWRDDDNHFLLYHDVLDILVVFVNRQLVDPSLAMTTVEILLEAQTVQNAERLFVYLESRMDRLTKDMVPGKGKALVILRTLNDLLRRLSKSTHTVFCGRILLFLASIFPLGERSGVNLRGEFNKENITGFELEEPRALTEPGESLSEKALPGAPEPADTRTVNVDGENEDSKMVEEDLIPRRGTVKNESDLPETATAKEKLSVNLEAPEDGEEVEEQKMDIDDCLKAADTGSSQLLDTPTRAADRKSSNEPEFYTLFWTLQRYLSDPLSIFQTTINSSLPPIISAYAASFPLVPSLGKDGTVSSTPTAAATPNLTILRQSITKTLEVFSEASKKEKALQGASTTDRSGRSTSLNSGESARLDKSLSSEEDVKRMFFYPKFLTSKSLLDLEIADSNFRKQIMVQCLILFQYLHSFTEAARLRSTPITSNKSLQLPYRLSEADHKWVRDLDARIYIEISRTPPDGEHFVKTVRVVLQGERNWARWKAQSCQLFEKAPLGHEASATAQANKKKLDSLTPSFPFKAGTSALSRLWLNEPKQLHEFVKPGKEKDLQLFFDAVKHQNELIKTRTEALANEGKSEATDLAADSQMQFLEERKASLAWRTLRIVSSTQLHLFGKIGVNDIEKLMEEMSKATNSTEVAPTAVTSTIEELESLKDDLIKSQASVDTDTNVITEDTASPAPGKRPRADSGMEIDQEEVKKQKVGK